MKVSTLIHRDLTSCTTHDDLARVAQLMWEHDVGCLPVIDAQGHVAGMITDRDVCMAAYTQGLPLRAIAVGSAMAHHVYACGEGDEVEAVEQVMRARQIRRVPVIDDQGHPVGILSINDLARAAAAGQVAAQGVAATLSAVAARRPLVRSPG